MVRPSIDIGTLSHVFAVLLYPVANTMASKVLSFLPSNSTVLPSILEIFPSTWKEKQTWINWRRNITYIFFHMRNMLTFIVPFLIKLIVPTSITADRPVFAFWRRGPNFGLTIPCFERSPNTKFDNLTRRPSTTFAGMCWTKVMPNRIISFVTTCTCKHTTCHTHIYFCKSTAAYIDKYRAFMFLELSPFKKN